MLQRCSNPNRKDYKYYGGKGIKVCESWKKLSNFISDMAPRPSKKHTLDRINSESNYCIENCRWATAKEQALNKSTTIVINGKCLTDWATELNLAVSTVSVRYAKYGKYALCKDFIPNGIQFNGVTKTMSGWAAGLNLSVTALSRRISTWGLSKALTTKKYETRIGNKNSCCKHK